MKFGERIAALDRLQKSRFFKLIATARLFCRRGWLRHVPRQIPRDARARRVPAASRRRLPPSAEKKDAAGGTNNPVVQSEAASAEDADARRGEGDQRHFSHRARPHPRGVTIASAVAFAVLAVWLGLGIWYAILALLLWAIYAAGQNLSGLGGWATFLVERRKSVGDFPGAHRRCASCLGSRTRSFRSRVHARSGGA